MKGPIGYRASTCAAALMLAGLWTANVQAQTDIPSADADAASAQNGGITDIVVTAQRRAETVQKSSLTIQVLGSDELARQGVAQAKDLVALVPGLQIAQGGNQTQTYIRGIGDFSSTGLGQSAVAYNIDGVYIGDQASVSPLFYDVSRLEVLKGPQGTLYGRNSSGGAINIITNRPTAELGMNASVEFANYDSVRATGAVNVPLSSTLSVRGAFQYVTRDGYLSDGTDDDQQRSGRLQILWKPSDRVSLLISGDIEHVGGKGAGSVLLPRQPGTGKFTGATDPVNNAALLEAAGALAGFVQTPGSGIPVSALSDGHDSISARDNTQRNIMAELNVDLGFADMTFIPAYRSSNNHYFGFLPGFPYLNHETAKQQSYELRFSKNTDRFKLVAGVFYLDMDQTIDQLAVISTIIPTLTSAVNPRLGTKSYAGFAQGTIDLTDRLRLIAGGRYTYEDRSIDGSRITLATVQTYENDVTYKSFSYRGGAEFDLSPRNMLYATVSKGFKSGGFNTFAPTATQSNAYDPETLYSYTAGVRNRFLDNKLQLNVEGFYWDYRDSQQSHLAFDPLGNQQFMTFNAASATSYGFDADLMFKATPNDTFTATIAYLHTKFDDFQYSIPEANYREGSVGCPVTISGGNANIDCSGMPLPRAPKWSGTAGYQHRFDLKDGSSVVAGTDMSFGSRRYAAVDYIAAENLPGYVRFNANLTYSSPDDHFSVTAFVKNIGNRAVYIGGVEAPLSPGIVYTSVDSPRTYGIRVAGKF